MTDDPVAIDHDVAELARISLHAVHVRAVLPIHRFVNIVPSHQDIACSVIYPVISEMVYLIAANEHVIGKQEISSSANSEILSLIDEGELSSSTDEVDSHIDQDNSEARMNHEKLILLADVTAGEIQDSQALYDELSEGEFES